MQTLDVVATLESIKKSQENYYRRLEDLFKQENMFEPAECETLASRLEREKKAPTAQTIMENVAEKIISDDENNKGEFYPTVDAPDRVYNAVSNARTLYLDAMDKAEKCIAPIHQNPLRQALYRITDRIGITSPAKRMRELQDRYFNTSAELNKTIKDIESEIYVLYDERKNLGELLPKNPDMTKENERKDLIDKHKMYKKTKAAMDGWIYDLRQKRDKIYGRKALIGLALSEFGIYMKNMMRRDNV